MKRRRVSCSTSIPEPKAPSKLREALKAYEEENSELLFEWGRRLAERMSSFLGSGFFKDKYRE